MTAPRYRDAQVGGCVEALVHTRDDGLTIVQGVPAMYARLLQTLGGAGAPLATQLRFAYAGGSPLAPSLGSHTGATSQGLLILRLRMITWLMLAMLMWPLMKPALLPAPLKPREPTGATEANAATGEHEDEAGSARVSDARPTCRLERRLFPSRACPHRRPTLQPPHPPSSRQQPWSSLR